MNFLPAREDLGQVFAQVALVSNAAVVTTDRHLLDIPGISVTDSF